MANEIAPGTTSDLIGYFPDLMLTFMDLIGAYDILPAGIDGLSVAPTLLGKPAEQKRHEFLVWSFPAYTGQQAVRLGSWKAVRRNLQQGKSPLELYDMATDVWTPFSPSSPKSSSCRKRPTLALGKFCLMYWPTIFPSLM